MTAAHVDDDVVNSRPVDGVVRLVDSELHFILLTKKVETLDKAIQIFHQD